MSGIIRQKIYYIEIVLEKLQKSGIMLCVLQTRGGVAEWSKAATRNRLSGAEPLRGFKSHLLRQIIKSLANVEFVRPFYCKRQTVSTSPQSRKPVIIILL